MPAAFVIHRLSISYTALCFSRYRLYSYRHYTSSSHCPSPVNQPMARGRHFQPHGSTGKNKSQTGCKKLVAIHWLQKSFQSQAKRHHGKLRSAFADKDSCDFGFFARRKITVARSSCGSAELRGRPAVWLKHSSGKSVFSPGWRPHSHHMGLLAE